MHTCEGGCHCGLVKFEVVIPGIITVHQCNCSICRKSGYLHLIVAADHFNLLHGEKSLSEYRFHTGVARHLFCSQCGIKSFYVPRSHPESFSVNLNCIELLGEISVAIETFDGRNWSENRERLDKTTTEEKQPG